MQTSIFFNFIWLIPVAISVLLLIYAKQNTLLFIQMKKDVIDCHTEIENLKHLLIDMTIKWKDATDEIAAQRKLIHELNNQIQSVKIIKPKDKVNILLIAVENSDIQFNEEITEIFNSGIEYTLLNKNVTKSRIINELARDDYEIVHVISHAKESGVILDGDIAEAGWWKRVCQQYKINLLFLNACKTLEIVDRAGAKCAIGTSWDITDENGILFAKDFYNWFAQGKSYKDSYELAKLSLSTKAAQLVRIIGNCD